MHQNIHGLSSYIDDRVNISDDMGGDGGVGVGPSKVTPCRES